MNDLTAISVGFGLVFGLVCTEAFGLAGSGLVVPGYIALRLNEPLALLTTLAVSLATFAAVRLLASIAIVHGRRRSAACILIGYLLGVLVDGWGIQLAGGDSLATIGLVVPGLLALWMDRQGVVETLSAVTIVSTLVRLGLIAAAVEGLP